jgi:predicted TIM-barrel fold metal-dependent hydrolase
MTEMHHQEIERHLHCEDLVGKVVDVHSHIGIAIREAAQIDFPYCSSAEDLAYRQKANGVDFGVVFPISPALHYDLPTLIETGALAPAARPISAVPYERENRLLLTDVYQFCPEHSHRFLPFISVDPGRLIDEQIASLEQLEREFPIYGVKIHPLMAQSKALALLGVGAPLLDFFAARNWPVLFHASLDPTDPFSQVADILQIAERHPETHFCMAHGIGCHRPSFERDAALPNVYVDTAALKIQVELFRADKVRGDEWSAQMLDLDYDDHTRLFQELVERYPTTMLWASDSPYHSYITRRLQGEGVYREFRLKGTYEQEVAAWRRLTPAQQQQVNANTIRFLFGVVSESDGS